MTGPRPVRAARGPERSCKGWIQEAALRMLMNNLDPEVAERPQDLVVYGGTGKAARDWPSFDAICRTLVTLGDDETLLVQSGRPVGVFTTHAEAPRVLIANANLVGRWATWEVFRELERKGLIMYGQMTAGSWIYIGTQGILQGTYETFGAVARRHFGGSLQGRVVLTGDWAGWEARNRSPPRCTAACASRWRWIPRAWSDGSRRAISTARPRRSTRRCAGATRRNGRAKRCPSG